MKKLKLFGLIAMMLVVATVLCACGNFANLNKVYNEAYDADARQFTAATVIADLEDYANVGGNGEFAVFTKTLDDGKLATKVYSFRKQAVVGTFTNSDSTTVAVAALANLPAFCVTSVTNEGKDDEVKTLAYYDVEGKEIVKIDAKAMIAGARKVNDKLAIIDTVAYTIDTATGLMTKKADVPAYVAYDVIGDANDEYFYEFNNGVVIYDIDFKPVAVWNAPSYAESLKPVVLNNGAVLVQYSVELDEDAKKFDYYADGNKYDLVSLVINTKGNVKDVDLDYIVLGLATNYTLYDENKATEDNQYTDKFENIATIARIENQLIDENPDNFDYVLMNNSGKAQKSLKVVDGQTGLPKRISADMFAVETVYGTAIIDAKGKVLFAVTAENVDVFGGYIIVEGRAIYDLAFELVYDLKANYATVEHKAGNVVFVKAGEKVDEKYEILAFVNGAKESKSITTYDSTVTTNVMFAKESVGYSLMSKDAEGKATYTYYAPDGTELLKTKAPIAHVATSGNGDVAIYTATEVVDGKAVTKFYAFTKAAVAAE